MRVSGWFRLVLLAAAMSGAPGPLAAQEAPPPDEGLTEQVQTMQSDLDRLKKIKISGYLQLRLERSQSSDDSVKAAGNPLVLTPANLDRFYIRRGRIKLTYDPSERSQAVVQIDGGSDRQMRLLDAYLTISDPWTPYQNHQLTFGQFNTPFGYEVERSSSVRELPERSRAENVLFPGERDRGIRLNDRWSDRFETTVAVLNGGGIGNADYPNGDPTAGKDWTARARLSLGWLDVAASGYHGSSVVAMTGRDVGVDRTRFGADAQYFYALPRLGGGSLRGEWYTGEEANPDSVSALTTKVTSDRPIRMLKSGASPGHLDSEFQGGYLMWVQNLGDRFQAAARYEVFDRNIDVDHDRYERWNLGLNYFFDGFTRLTLACDIPRTQARSGRAWIDPDDNLWTFQAQYRF